MTMHRFAGLASQAGIAIFLLALAALPARAATWTVTGTGEPAALATQDCSGSSCATLRGAINRAADGDSIVFAPALDGQTIRLTRYTNCLNVDQANGSTCLRPGAGWPAGQVEQFGRSAFYLHDRHLTIDASALAQGIVIARDSSAASFRLFDVGRAAGLTLRGVTLRNGRAQGGSAYLGGGALGAGGAIFNRGDLVIEHGTLEGNTARGGAVGAGAGYGGAGVGQNGGEGAGGPNARSGFGGGGGEREPDHDGIGGWGGGGGGNSRWRPPLGGYALLGTQSVGEGGFGGGKGGSSGPNGPTLGHNGDGMGGAIFNDAGSVVLRNATLTGNTAARGSTQNGGGDGFGGALYNYSGIVTLEAVTIAGNSAPRSPGIYSLADGACRRGGNLACTNGDAALLAIDRSLVESLRMNRVGTGAGDSAATGSGNLLETIPVLAGGASIAGLGYGVVPGFGLGNLPGTRKGGYADVRIPDNGSPAIDAGGACSGHDQRRTGRPQGPACDIGAVEVATPRPFGCYVRASAPVGGDGSGWNTAYPTLQQALQDASCSTIKVAAGVYRPASTADRHATFRITRGLTVLGGFPAAGGADDVRDPDTHFAILSGDVDDNDTNLDGNFINEHYDQTIGSNSYHVVTVQADGQDIVLDGLIVTAGRASTNSGDLGRGAGILALGGELRLVKLRMSGQRAYRGAALYLGAGTVTLVDSVVSGNYTIEQGGSIYLASGTTAEIRRSLLADNLSFTQGGAVYAHTGTSLQVIDSEFRGNRADVSGGALYSHEDVAVLRSLFHANTSGARGGAISNAGSLELAHTTISGNEAVQGGAIMNGSTSSLALVHATVFGNRSTSMTQAGGLHLADGAEASIHASVVAGTTRGWDCIDHDPASGNVEVVGSLIGYGLGDCVGTLPGAPGLSPLEDHGGPTRVHMPGPGSVLLDRTECPTGAQHGSDQRAIARPQGGACDVGAVEARQRTLALAIDGQGSVAADRAPIGAGPASCSGSCNWPWPEAGSVVLTATSATGWQFDGWGGHCAASGAASETTVLMTANRSCTADFSLREYTLTYIAGSNGSLQGELVQVVPHGGVGSPVTAVPDTGYRFAQWSDGATLNPRSDGGMSSDVTVTALFVPDAQYSLSYAAGPNGSLAGPTQQTVDHGEDGAPVTALADAGYHFDDWSDGRTDNPRTDAGVTADIAVTARFQPDLHALNYAAGPNGSLVGDTAQQVAHGESGTPVEAIPDEGHAFVAWSDGRSDNPRTDSAVTGPLDVVASFALRQYRLDYGVSGSGSLLGDASQLVAHGGDGTPVQAVADEGHVFAQWNDGRSDNPRTDTAVLADASFTALFTPRTYTLAYGAGAGGSIAGEALQSVAHGEDGSPVTAVPEPGYRFAGWSDAREDNPRIDTGVTADLAPGAMFEAGSYTLAVAVAPSATGTLSVLEGDPDALPFNGSVLLGIAPAPGWDLAHADSFPPVLACSHGNRSLVVQELGGMLTVDSGPITADCALTVYFANQAPSFTAGPARVASLLGDGEVGVAWADDPRPDRDGNASGQAYAFVLDALAVEPQGASLFAAGGAPTIDDQGMLRFTPGTDTGMARFAVRLKDAAGSDYGGSDTSPDVILDIQIGSRYVGLSLEPLVPATLNFPGDRVALALDFANAGPTNASAARATWTPPAGLQDVAWTCAAQDGAACAVASGEGALDLLLELEVGARARVLVEATIAPVPPPLLESLAAVGAGPGQADGDPGDDQAPVRLKVDGLFRDGMEGSP